MGAVENILIQKTSSGINLFLLDYGCVKNLDNTTSAPIGTVGYIDPDPNRAGTCAGDVFALGVTLLEIVMRRRVEHNEDPLELAQRIADVRTSTFIHRFLSPTDRLTAAELLEHPWTRLEFPEEQDNVWCCPCNRPKEFDETVVATCKHCSIPMHGCCSGLTAGDLRKTDFECSRSECVKNRR
eukprot:TRINITY_DN7964_c0_g1_i1.p1 TRINITY_DN7964_c0_g1~~TRINITY_DN7964_c0_g1_i1.p1  ORF type:complete len:183 (-),score=40.02 TRINITY_DN7964_c0_g1_i1:34-582(-)